MDRGVIMQGKDYLIGHMEDLADKAAKTGCSASRFLTPAEARHVVENFRYSRIKLLFDGGYDNAERVRAVFISRVLLCIKLDCGNKGRIIWRDDNGNHCQETD